MVVLKLLNTLKKNFDAFEQLSNSTKTAKNLMTDSNNATKLYNLTFEEIEAETQKRVSDVKIVESIQNSSKTKTISGGYIQWLHPTMADSLKIKNSKDRNIYDIQEMESINLPLNLVRISAEEFNNDLKFKSDKATTIPNISKTASAKIQVQNKTSLPKNEDKGNLNIK